LVDRHAGKKTGLKVSRHVGVAIARAIAESNNGRESWPDLGRKKGQELIVWQGGDFGKKGLRYGGGMIKI